MPTTFEYMQFATGVYAASDRNALGDPTGWTLNAWQPDTNSGFSAGYYFNSQTNEAVISYTGTNGAMDAVIKKGVSIALFLEQPCHDVHALN
jgi:hypothetical protein